MERGLIDDYEARIDGLLAELSAERLAIATQIAQVPEQIRGFGHVKLRHVEQARLRWESLAGQWDGETATASDGAMKIIPLVRAA